MAVHLLAPRFCTIELVGRADNYAVPTADNFLAAVAPIEGVELFWDAGRLESITGEFRAACTDGLLPHRKTVGGIYVFTHSALISMAVSTANLVLGGVVRSFRDEEAFAEAKREGAARHGVDPHLLAG